MNIVVGIIRSKEDLVFLQRKDGSWTFPSGKVEPEDESLDAALIREVEEETGLSVAPVFNLGSRQNGDDIIYYKVCQLLGGELQLKEPDKFLAVQWMNAGTIAEKTALSPIVSEYLSEHVRHAPHRAVIPA